MYEVKEHISGRDFCTRHMFFSLVVSHLSATGHDALSALCFVQPNYDECRLPLGMAFGFHFVLHNYHYAEYGSE
jgi:hypothetical protein